MKILDVIKQANLKGYTHVSAHGDAMPVTIASFEQDVINKDKFYRELYNLTYNDVQDDFESNVCDYGRVYSVGDTYPAMTFLKKKGQ